MASVFQLNMDRKILVASQNVFLTPQPHPTRTLSEHVLSYVVKGGWKLNIGGETVVAKKDCVFIQPSNITQVEPATYGLQIHCSAS